MILLVLDETERRTAKAYLISHKVQQPSKSALVGVA